MSCTLSMRVLYVSIRCRGFPNNDNPILKWHPPIKQPSGLLIRSWYYIYCILNIHRIHIIYIYTHVVSLVDKVLSKNWAQYPEVQWMNHHAHCKRLLFVGVQWVYSAYTMRMPWYTPHSDKPIHMKPSCLTLKGIPGKKKQPKSHHLGHMFLHNPWKSNEHTIDGGLKLLMHISKTKYVQIYVQILTKSTILYLTSLTSVNIMSR